MEQVTKIEQSDVVSNFVQLGDSVGWNLTHDECVVWMKVAVAGITDAVNQFKSKEYPVVVLVQDLKGNKIIFACSQYIKADDEDETAQGSWTYFWSYDMADIPEDAKIYTLDQDFVQQIIAKRGHDMVNMVMTNLPFVAQLCVYMFNLIKDALDQKAVEDGSSLTFRLDGYFEASVEVNNGVKKFSFMPMGEMKMLIKDDAASEK